MARPRSSPSGPRRLLAAWSNLAREQRTVVVTSAALLLTMFLPWYSRSVTAVVGTDRSIESVSSSKLAITVFSFVEAAIFLVAVGVTALVLARGDRRAFHLPGGDGTIVTIAGGWATFLIFFRFVDKPSGGSGSQIQIEYGLSWGIFFGLIAALALLAAGLRLRAANVAEPALPGDVAPSDATVPLPRRRPAPAGDAERPAEPDSPREQRRREREARRRGPGPSVETPVRERREPRAPEPAEAPTRRLDAAESPTRRLDAEARPAAPAPPRPDASEAPTTVRPRPQDPPSLFDDLPAEPPAPEPAPTGFEPPEFEPPPRRRREP